MKRFMKCITMFSIILMSLFICKMNTSAEVIWNTSGELNPWGGNYKYKYWSGNQWVYSNSGTVTNPSQLVDISYEVTYCYEEAYKMNEYVNEQRRKAGVPEVQMKDEIMDVAMKRAAQTALYWEHIRPDGTSHSAASMYVSGENLCCNTPYAKDANKSLVESPGHYQNMIKESHRYAGYGCVKLTNGGYYWVQIFSSATKYYEDGFDINNPENNKPVQWELMTAGERKDYTEIFTAKIKPEYITLESALYLDEFSSSMSEMNQSQTGDIRLYTMYRDRTNQWTCYVLLTPDQYDVKVLTPTICSYSNGTLTGLSAGTAKLQFTLKADTSISTVLEVKVKAKKIKKGDIVAVDSGTYKVTNVNKRTVTFNSVLGDETDVTVPQTVTLGGKTYKVTAIAANAFKKNKNLKRVTIGANVTKINKNAFSGCVNLKKITIKSTKLSSVGKNALKGIHKKAVIKVPKSKLKKYKQLLSGKGQKKTVKIKK